MPEELTWRGISLDRLQALWNPLRASLVLGLLWAVWHLPLFFVKGTYQQAEVGISTYRGLSFLLGIIASSILMTWVYNLSNRSTLTAIAMHFMTNLTGEFLNLPDNQEYWRTA